jgi:hypothetical protein
MFERYNRLSEILSPIRCASPAAGVMPGTRDGLHGSQCADEHSRTRLLPRDEKPVRPDGDAGVAWLLPQDSAERSRQCAGYKDGDIPSGCSLCSLVGCFRVGESDLRYHWMGRTPRLFASEVPARNNFHPKNLVRSSPALYFAER